MNKIIELINNFDSFFGIFVPGAVCVWFYTKLSLKKYEAQVYFIMSIAIGYLIQMLMGLYAGSRFYVADLYFPVSLAVAVIVAFLYYRVKNSFWTRNICTKILGIESGDNIWTRFYDGNGTVVYAYLTNGKVVCGIVSSVDNDYMTLVCHTTADSSDEKDMDKATDRFNDKTVLCIPMSKIDRFELTYSNDDSKYKKQNLTKFLG